MLNMERKRANDHEAINLVTLDRPMPVYHRLWATNIRSLIQLDDFSRQLYRSLTVKCLDKVIRLLERSIGFVLQPFSIACCTVKVNLLIK